MPRFPMGLWSDVFVEVFGYKYLLVLIDTEMIQ